MQIRHKGCKLERLINILKNHFLNCGMWVAPHIPQLATTNLDRMAQDEVIKDFVARYEVPCIQFENMMMGKYFGEPGRTLDYIHSVDISSLPLNRDSFVDSALAGVRADVPARSTPYFPEEPPETTIAELAPEQTRSTQPPITGAMPGASSANAASMITPETSSPPAMEKGKDIER